VVIETEEPQGEIFELLKRTLTRLSTGDTRLAAIRIHFVLRTLRLAGFHPQLDECTGCTRHLQQQQAFWSARQGGLLCERCLHEDPHAPAIAPELLEVLSACAESREPIEIHPDQATSLQPRLDAFLRWQIDRPLKTLRPHHA
jgi:DNA repair protein RecO